MLQVSKNFVLQEFIDPKTYSNWGDKSLWFIDQRIINICQWLRDKLGKPIEINNWHLGGSRNESGLRKFDTVTGAGMSQHKFGRAVDIVVSDMPAEDVRQFIRDNYSELRELGLTTIEKDTPTWVHFDVRFTGKSELNEIPYQ